MPTATAAFSDSTAGEIGIDTFMRAAAAMAAEAPCPSLPTAKTKTSAGDARSKRFETPFSPGVPPSRSHRSSLPASIASRQAAALPRAKGIVSAVPADARSALAPSGSAVPSEISTPDAPNAAATRRIAPTLPGS